MAASTHAAIALTVFLFAGCLSGPVSPFEGDEAGGAHEGFLEFMPESVMEGAAAAAIRFSWEPLQQGSCVLEWIIHGETNPTGTQTALLRENRQGEIYSWVSFGERNPATVHVEDQHPSPWLEEPPRPWTQEGRSEFSGDGRLASLVVFARSLSQGATAMPMKFVQTCDSTNASIHVEVATAASIIDQAGTRQGVGSYACVPSCTNGVGASLFERAAAAWSEGKARIWGVAGPSLMGNVRIQGPPAEHSWDLPNSPWTRSFVGEPGVYQIELSRVAAATPAGEGTGFLLLGGSFVPASDPWIAPTG